MSKITKKESYDFIEETVQNIELEGLHSNSIKNLENKLTEALYGFVNQQKISSKVEEKEFERKVIEKKLNECIEKTKYYREKVYAVRDACKKDYVSFGYGDLQVLILKLLGSENIMQTINVKGSKNVAKVIEAITVNQGGYRFHIWTDHHQANQPAEDISYTIEIADSDDGEVFELVGEID